MPQTVLVRIKPYAPRQGLVLKTFTHRDIQFQVERGWYEVPAFVGAELAEIHSQPEDPTSPLGFDVCSKDEAVAKEEAERRAAKEKAEAVEPIKVTSIPIKMAAEGTLTTADLPGGEDIPGSPRARRRGK